jgi:hypothetical protein
VLVQVDRSQPAIANLSQATTSKTPIHPICLIRRPPPLPSAIPKVGHRHVVTVSVSDPLEPPWMHPPSPLRHVRSLPEHVLAYTVARTHSHAVKLARQPFKPGAAVTTAAPARAVSSQPPLYQPLFPAISPPGAKQPHDRPQTPPPPPADPWCSPPSITPWRLMEPVAAPLCHPIVATRRRHLTDPGASPPVHADIDDEGATTSAASRPHATPRRVSLRERCCGRPRSAAYATPKACGQIRMIWPRRRHPSKLCGLPAAGSGGGWEGKKGWWRLGLATARVARARSDAGARKICVQTSSGLLYSDSYRATYTIFSY